MHTALAQYDFFEIHHHLFNSDSSSPGSLFLFLVILFSRGRNTDFVAIFCPFLAEATKTIVDIFCDNVKGFLKLFFTFSRHVKSVRILGKYLRKITKELCK